MLVAASRRKCRNSGVVGRIPPAAWRGSTRIAAISFVKRGRVSSKLLYFPMTKSWGRFNSFFVAPKLIVPP